MIYGKEEKMALIILLAAILIMSGFAVFMEIQGIYMFSPPYSEEADTGTLVTISGIADDIRETQSGGHMITYINEIKIFIPSDIVRNDLFAGDFIRVDGIVEEYMGEREIRAIKIELNKKTD